MNAVLWPQSLPLSCGEQQRRILFALSGPTRYIRSIPGGLPHNRMDVVSFSTWLT